MFDGFLQAFGLLALLLGGAVLWVIWQWKTRLKRWVHYGLAASINRFPGRIRLRPLGEFRWLKGDRAAQRVRVWHDLGFEDLGGFAIDELPDARLFALRHPTTHVLAIVHEQDELGTWSDALVFKPGEAQPILASSILKRAHLFLLPGDPKLHRPTAGCSSPWKISSCAAWSGTGAATRMRRWTRRSSRRSRRSCLTPSTTSCASCAPRNSCGKPRWPRRTGSKPGIASPSSTI